MAKNLCNKVRKVDEPYEVWKSYDGTWEWRVLKKYQSEEKERDNPYARWFCAVRSPFTFDQFEYGDTYVSEIKNNAVKIN